MDIEKRRIRLIDVRDEIAATRTLLDQEIEQLRVLTLRTEELKADIDELLRQESWLARKAGESPLPPLRPLVYVPDPEIEDLDDDESNEQTINPAKAVAKVRHADVIKEVLREAGGPRRIPDLINPILATGHKLPESPNIRFNTIYTAMKRREEVFISLPNGFWGLVGRDEPTVYQAPLWDGENQSATAQVAQPETEDDKWKDI